MRLAAANLDLDHLPPRMQLSVQVPPVQDPLVKLRASPCSKDELVVFSGSQDTLVVLGSSPLKGTR
jgi:hypothetical protein